VQQNLIKRGEALGLAAMVYNATKQRFMIGESDIYSLTLSLDRQKVAHRNYTNALKEYWI